MKVLHVSGAYSWGGNEQQLVDAIFGLQKLNVTNIILCFKGSPMDLYAKENNIIARTIKKQKSFAFPLLKFLKKIVVEDQIDVIHLHTSNSVTTYVVADMLLNLKVPTVFSKKGISGTKSGLSAFKYNYKNIKKVICVSGAVKEAFKGTLKPENHHKMEVVYDGIKIERATQKADLNLREQYNIPHDTPIIGNIANHARAKDLVTFVKTIDHLVNTLNFKNVHFVQIGKPSKYTETFMPLVKEYNLEKYISFTGFTTNAMDLLSQLDVYFMSSSREGLPITIYEAFYKKIPVISTKAGGIPEAITHDVNGLLADTGDYVTLAKHIESLLSNRSKIKTFKEKSYDLVLSKFTTKQLAQSTLEIYQEVTKNA